MSRPFSGDCAFFRGRQSAAMAGENGTAPFSDGWAAIDPFKLLIASMKAKLLGGLLIVLSAGCGAMNSDRQFTNIGVDPQGQQVGIPSAYIENYAKERRVSREEAIKHFRDELLASDSAAAENIKPASSTATGKAVSKP
jgi:hypothetical protein